MMQSASSRLLSAVCAACAPSVVSASEAKPQPRHWREPQQWVHWSSENGAEDHLAAKLCAPKSVNAVVVRAQLCKEDGCHVEKGEEVCVVEWAELQPWLPVKHLEVVVAPASGKLVVSGPKGSDHREVGVYLCLDNADDCASNSDANQASVSAKSKW